MEMREAIMDKARISRGEKLSSKGRGALLPSMRPDRGDAYPVFVGKE